MRVLTCLSTPRSCILIRKKTMSHILFIGTLEVALLQVWVEYFYIQSKTVELSSAQRFENAACQVPSCTCVCNWTGTRVQSTSHIHSTSRAHSTHSANPSPLCHSVYLVPHSGRQIFCTCLNALFQPSILFHSRKCTTRSKAPGDRKTRVPHWRS